MIIQLFKAVAFCTVFCTFFAFRMELQHHTALNDWNNNWSLALQLIPYDIPTMRLCFGIPNQCFNVAPTLTSSLTIIQNEAVNQKLFPNSFNISLSSTHVDLHYHLKFKTIKNKIDGKLFRDLVLISNMPMPEIKFTFLVYQSFHNTLELPIDGFLGLQKYYSEEDVFYSVDSSFIHFLRNARLIEKIGFALSYSNKYSYIEFGELYPRYDKCRSPKSDHNHREWDCRLNEVVIGEIKVNATEQIVSFDSISKTINAPRQFNEYLNINLLKKLFPSQCVRIIFSSKTIIQCEESINIDLIPDITLVMENEVKLILKWNQIFKKIRLNKKIVYVSTIVIEEDNYINWKIGLPGMMNHKIIFDTVDNSVGIINNVADEISLLSQSLYFIVASVLIGGILMLIVVDLKHTKTP